MGFILKALLRLLVTAAVVLAIAYVIPGVHVSSVLVALIVALVWGVITLIVRPILFILTLPINFLTFGLFTFILNALLFWLTAALVPGFSVSGFIPALQGSVILAVVGWVLHTLW
jgi:putative membrane protein